MATILCVSAHGGVGVTSVAAMIAAAAVHDWPSDSVALMDDARGADDLTRWQSLRERRDIPLIEPDLLNYEDDGWAAVARDEAEYKVVDGGTAWRSQGPDYLRRADLVVPVFQPDGRALLIASMRRMIEAAGKPAFVILNRAASGGAATAAALAELATAWGRPPDCTLPACEHIAMVLRTGRAPWETRICSPLRDRNALLRMWPEIKARARPAATIVDEAAAA